ncbi:DUF2283 domain-containing protein [Candidatus Woesearchaeota archaeon]|nr:DUF2283 domain-containing protein [Candidatus Woesearchaeota archaeon]
MKRDSDIRDEMEKMQNFNVSYDKEVDDLFLFSPKEKSKGSIEIGDIVIDMNNKKEVVGIQIMNAVELLIDLTEERLDPQYVENEINGLKKCKVDFKVKNNLLLIKMYIFKRPTILSVPCIKTPSPALYHNNSLAV